LIATVDEFNRLVPVAENALVEGHFGRLRRLALEDDTKRTLSDLPPDLVMCTYEILLLRSHGKARDGAGALILMAPRPLAKPPSDARNGHNGNFRIRCNKVSRVASGSLYSRPQTLQLPQFKSAMYL
jgi:hypothetical protein